MKLTPELFEQITGFKESSIEQLQSKKKDDLRVVPRLPLTFRSSACRIEGDRFDPPIQIHISEISALGVTLTHAIDHRLGKAFVIAIKPRQKGNLIAIYCEMTNFQSAGQTQMRVGARFVRIGTDADVRRCIGLEIPAGNPTHHAPSTTPSAPPKPAAIMQQAIPQQALATMPPARQPAVSRQPAASLQPEEIKRIRDAMLS